MPTPRVAHPWIQSLDDHLFLLTYPDRFTDEEVEGFVGAWTPFVESIPRPYAWVVDLGGLMRATASQRKAIQAMGDRNADFAAKHSAGTAIVAKNAVARALVKTTYLVKRPPFEVSVVRSVAEGERWAREQLARRL